MFDRLFWKATAERAVRTVAQTLLSLWLVGDVAFNLFTVDWTHAAGVALGAGVVSVLMSVAANTRDGFTGPSFGTERPRDPLVE